MKDLSEKKSLADVNNTIKPYFHFPKGQKYIDKIAKGHTLQTLEEEIEIKLKQIEIINTQIDDITQSLTSNNTKSETIQSNGEFFMKKADEELSELSIEQLSLEHILLKLQSERANIESAITRKQKSMNAGGIAGPNLFINKINELKQQLVLKNLEIEMINAKILDTSENIDSKSTQLHTMPF